MRVFRRGGQRCSVVMGVLMIEQDLRRLEGGLEVTLRYRGGAQEM